MSRSFSLPQKSISDENHFSFFLAFGISRLYTFIHPSGAQNMSDTGASWVAVAACGGVATAAAVYYAYRCGCDAAHAAALAEGPPVKKSLLHLRVSAVKKNDDDKSSQASSDDEAGVSPLSPATVAAASIDRPSTPNGRRLW
jgi:hypothetical protein